MLNKGTPNQTQSAGNPIQLQQGVPTKFSLSFAYWYQGLTTWSVVPQAGVQGLQITANVQNPIQAPGSVGTNDQIIPDAVTMLVTAPVGTYLSIQVSIYQADGSGGMGSSAILVTAPPVTTGSVAISSSPVGAEIFIDGTDQNQATPATISNIPAGSHTVTLTLAGYTSPGPVSFNIVAGQTTTVPTITLQSGCSQTITITPIDPDVVPVSMTFDKASGAAPLTVNVTLVYKNNTPNTISNAKALLWVGSTPTSIAIPSMTGNGTVNVPTTVSLTTAGSYAIRPEVPDGFTLPALYGDVLSKGVVDAANQTAIANFAMNVPPAPTINQIAVGDLARNGSIQMLDASSIMAIYLGQIAGPQTVYTPVGRNVVTIPTQTVTVTAPAIGSLAISSVPSGAEIFINGTDTGYMTPTTFNNLTPGSYVVLLKKSGYQDWSQSVSITAGQTTTGNPALIPVVILPVQSACSLPTTVSAGQDGTATVTVLAGNMAKNAVFSIQKAGVECSRTSTVAIPGDSATHTYTVTIPATGCLGNIAGTSASYSIQMIFV
jgi:hypothetical protein